MGYGIKFISHPSSLEPSLDRCGRPAPQPRPKLV
jgi:hypothetical protein